MIDGGRNNENCENNIWKICLRKNIGLMVRQTHSVLGLFNSYTYNVYSRLCLTPLIAFTIEHEIKDNLMNFGAVVVTPFVAST